MRILYNSKYYKVLPTPTQKHPCRGCSFRTEARECQVDIHATEEAHGLVRHCVLENVVFVEEGSLAAMVAYVTARVE